MSFFSLDEHKMQIKISKMVLPLFFFGFSVLEITVIIWEETFQRQKARFASEVLSKS